ncbi:hypothetical protein BC831DRAFT_97833 [Entophlyctis helioformis]|nr:hypothetical protein BC831DRAFT_97833 [Entophlyctis helioformis]
MQAGGRPLRDIHWTGRTRPHLNNAVVISQRTMSNETTATEHDASASPVFTEIDIYKQVSILDTLCCAIDTTTQLTVNGWLSWATDLIARSMLLWFTYYRTLSIWRNARFLLPLTLAIQLAQIAAWVFVVYLSLPSTWEAIPDRAPALMDLSIGLLAATDLLTGTIDLILISRMWTLRKSRTAAGTVDAVGDRLCCLLVGDSICWLHT